jgi:glycosyltransferase involved in cell wall biosynthesis
MRIGIDAHAIGSKSSGNETYYQQLLKHLATVQTNGSYFVVYYTRLAAAERVPVSEKFHWKRIRPATWFWRIPIAFPLEFQREKLDVFHAQYIIPPFCNCKTVTTIPDIAYEHYPEFFSNVDTLAAKLLIRSAAKKADHIITVSDYSKNDISRTYSIDPERITVTYEGAGLEFFPRDKAQCREHIARNYGIKSPFVLYVGRLQERKNLRRLLSAYARLIKQGAEENLVIVGKKDWMTENLESYAKSLGLTDSVIFTGYIPSADLPVVYNAAEAFVYPSIFEGFGLPVVEAMACGLPVLTSYGSSLQEVAGDAALLVDPFSEESIAQGLANLLGDSSLRVRLGQAGLARSATFSFQRTAEQTMRVYENVVAGAA